MTPPTDTALAGITARGRLLAAYDHANWVATDAMLEVLPNPVGVEGSWAEQTASGAWRVIYGKLSPDGDTLTIAVTVDQKGTADSFSVLKNIGHGNDTERSAFRALQTASKDLKSGPRAFDGVYNASILPKTGGGWWVYFLPAQTQADVFPHGGDYRYDISADGKKILAKLVMHKTVLNLAVPPDAVSGFNTVITADLPQDSDVFLVLARKPPKPEIVATEHFNFEIHLDGSISWSVKKP